MENDQRSREEVLSQKDIKHAQHADTSVEKLQGYLSDALKSSDAHHALRRANQFEGKTLGKNSGFGWALDEVVGKEDEARSGGGGLQGRGKSKRRAAGAVDPNQVWTITTCR